MKTKMKKYLRYIVEGILVLIVFLLLFNTMSLKRQVNQMNKEKKELLEKEIQNNFEKVNKIESLKSNLTKQRDTIALLREVNHLSLLKIEEDWNKKKNSYGKIRNEVITTGDAFTIASFLSGR